MNLHLTHKFLFINDKTEMLTFTDKTSFIRGRDLEFQFATLSRDEFCCGCHSLAESCWLEV